MMARMGMQLKEMGDITKVIFEGGGRRIIIENPEVAAVVIQGQTLYQVGGGKVKEESMTSTSPSSPASAPVPVTISPEDVSLVSAQAGASQKEAEDALRQSGGDLAQAILFLQKKKTQR